MPRMVRLARGIDGKKIFLDRNDFKEFLFRLRNGIKECGSEFQSL
jgi:hypothetical protein